MLWANEKTEEVFPLSVVSKSMEQKMPRWDLRKTSLHLFSPRLTLYNFEKFSGVVLTVSRVLANLQVGVILDLGVKDFWRCIVS